MRTISSASLALLAGKTAIESILIVGIQWVDGGQVFYYADRNIYDGGTLVAEGRVIELGAFDDVTRADGAGRNGSCSVKLSDLDGTLKGIFNRLDIHKRPVTVYQWFEGIAWTEKFSILEGQINTPLIWTEHERTLQFDVVSLLESYEVGYDISEGNAPIVPQELLGTAWPMIFGTVQHYPALQLRNVPTGILAQSFGTIDPTLSLQIASLILQQANLKAAAGLCLVYAAFACYDSASFDTLAEDLSTGNGAADCNSLPAVQSFNQQSAQFQDQAAQLGIQVRNLQATLAAQSVWAHGASVIPSNPIQVPYVGVVKINNSLFIGEITAGGGGVTGIPLLQPGQLPGISEAQLELFDSGNSAINKVLNPNVIGNTYIKQGSQFFSAGSQVSVAGPYDIPFAVSLIPGTVLEVWAYRSYNGLKQISQVPPAYYTVGTLAVGNFDCVTVTLKQPLSVTAFLFDTYESNWDSNFGQFLPSHIVPKIDWEDSIYVTFESSVGPNTIDILIYLINTYCPGLTYDATSFGYVAAKLVNYPMNFGLSARPNVIDLINELAYQNRCSVWISNNTFYILYRSEEATAVDTITEDDIEEQSFSIECTPTESLVTKYIGTYRPDYTPTYQEPVSVILRNQLSIKKYGVNQESHDFYAFNDYYLVEKSATFWMIQDSTSWKLLKCRLMLSKLNLETFDTVLLNFSHPYVANGPVKALVQSCTYNSAEQSIDAVFWVPVRLGEMTYYPFAWPANLTEQDIFPTYFDITSGGGGSPSGGNIIPLFNSQSQVVTANRQGERLRYSNGDPQPSDTGDFFTPIPLADNPVPQLRAAPNTGNYNYTTPTKGTITTPPMGGATFPGKISEYGGKDADGNSFYVVEGYPYGLNGPKKNLDNVSQLQIDEDDRIPNGTWAQISAQQVVRDGSSKMEYTMQVPVWLG